MDRATRDAIVEADPHSVDLLKPILRGRDIARYRANWADLWLISTFPSLNLDIDTFPAIRRHLLSFGKDRLAQEGRRLPSGGNSRKKTPNAWYELQDTCAYHEEFKKPKLFWIELADCGRFSYDDRSIFGEATTFVLTGKSIKFLCAVLNSKSVQWYLRNVAPTSGTGTLRWKKVYIETIPVPLISCIKQKPIVKLVNHIINLKKDASNHLVDTIEYEAEIDRLVFEFYGLSQQEISHLSQ